MKEYLNIRDKLVSACSICSERYRVGLESERNKQRYETELNLIRASMNELVETANHINKIYKNIKSYAANHRDSVKDLLNASILAAGELVPDADVDGIHLHQSENNTVMVLNGKGQPIAEREGGGYSAVLGLLLRYACTKAQPDALQIMLFDEYFYTLSDTTAALVKDVITAISKDIVIVCIEQRRNITDGISDITYVFKKDDKGNTEVSKLEGVVD